MIGITTPIIQSNASRPYITLLVEWPPAPKVEEANTSICVSEGVTSRMDLLTLYRLLLIAAALILSLRAGC